MDISGDGRRPEGAPEPVAMIMKLGKGRHPMSRWRAVRRGTSGAMTTPGTVVTPAMVSGSSDKGA